METKKRHRPDVHDTAKAFLKENYYLDNKLGLRYWRGNFYESSINHYLYIDIGELEIELRKYMLGKEFLNYWATTNFFESVFKAVKAIAHIPSRFEPPLWADETFLRFDKENLVVFKNGILNIKDSEFFSYGTDLFTLSCIPNDYDPSITELPIWQAHLDKVLPDKSTQSVLQEWFGYNLVNDISQQKFLLLSGRGRNGKGVICSVLRAMLGESNVSDLAMEKLATTSGFEISETFGKLANIYEEMKVSKDTATNALKIFVSAQKIQGNRKHKDFIKFTPTARLTFCANNLPDFSDDTTDAIWGRLLQIPFKVQILDESLQNKEMTRLEFWKRSGEIPAIINWALTGLKRLKGRGYFEESPEMKEAKAEFRYHTNYLEDWLMDNLEIEPGATFKFNILHEKFVWSCKKSLRRAGTANDFSSAIKNLFPSITPSKVVRNNGSLERLWLGAKIRKENHRVRLES